jgi:cytidyltransferase-like protein
MRPKVAVSGAFDPLHAGHIALFESAAQLGDVTVILKGDKRLARKKGTFLMCAAERKTILESIKYVSEVFVYDSEDKHHDDFSEALEFVRPDIYAAGADKKESGDVPFIKDVCNRLGIKIVYQVGGEKISNSSEILKNFVVSYVTKSLI